MAAIFLSRQSIFRFFYRFSSLRVIVQSCARKCTACLWWCTRLHWLHQTAWGANDGVHHTHTKITTIVASKSISKERECIVQWVVGGLSAFAARKRKLVDTIKLLLWCGMAFITNTVIRVWFFKIPFKINGLPELYVLFVCRYLHIVQICKNHWFMLLQYL